MHHYCKLFGPLKSDCPLECVRACSVCTGCRRDVDRARREIGIDVWIDGKTVRASRAHVPDHLCRCSHSLTAATVRRPRRPILWAGRAAAIESPAPRGAGPIGPVPRGADPARFGRCAAAIAPRTRRPRAHHATLTRCSRLSSAGTTALGGRHGRSSGQGERRRTRRCWWRARSAGGAGTGRRGGRARARGAVLGHAHVLVCAARAAQVRAVVSGTPGSSAPAPGRSGPARGSSLAVLRPERASGACLCAARGCSCACCEYVSVWWCEYALGVRVALAEWCRDSCASPIFYL